MERIAGGHAVAYPVDRSSFSVDDAFPPFTPGKTNSKTVPLGATSLKHATDFERRSSAGTVTVNVPTAGVDYHAPFGGRKGSSYGPHEQGSYAREFFTSVKTAYTHA